MIMSNSELIKQMTSYTQVSVDSDLSGKTIKFSEILSYEMTLVFTDRTYVHAENSQDFFCDETLFPGELGHPRGLTRLGVALEANLEPYLEYLKVEENKRKDRDYELYLELKEKFERKAGLP